MIPRAATVALAAAVLLPAAAAAAVFARFERQLLSSIERPAAIHPVPDLAQNLPAPPDAGLRAPDFAPGLPAPPDAGFRAPDFTPDIPAPPNASLRAPDIRRGIPAPPPPPVRAPAPVAAIAPPAPPSPRPPAAIPASLAISTPPAIGAATGGRLLFEGIRDGLVDPRLPSSRGPLAALLMQPGRLSRDDVFSALLGTFPGADAPSRIAALGRWADSLDESTAGEIALMSARRHFLDGRFALAAALADSAAGRFPGLAGRARLVKAFALAQAGDFDGASGTLAEAAIDPKLAADRPEIRFMQAWIAIEEDRRDDAAALLRRILADHPWSPFAGRARRALALLEEE